MPPSEERGTYSLEAIERFFEMSLHMQTVHGEWVKGYPHTSSRLQDALHQLNEIIAKYPELRCNEAALETIQNLTAMLASSMN